MPREQRLSSHSFRHEPMQRSPEQAATHRQTSIWTTEDDETLMAARAQGMNWQPIANVHFPSKSGNACRKRHERLMEKRNAEDWDGVNFERLAVEYMAVRQEMWTLLSSRLGDKWSNIEAKCMEKGIKNIQSAYKTAKRKERGMLKAHHPHDHDPDSGFGGSDTDAEYELDFVRTTATSGGGEASAYAPSPLAPTSRSPGMLPTASPSMMTTMSPSLMVSTSPSLNTSTSSSIVAASTQFMPHYAQQRYHPVPIQPMPQHDLQHDMMMGARAMLPGPHGRNMSIHAMLSPSPPGDDDDDDDDE